MKTRGKKTLLDKLGNGLKAGILAGALAFGSGKADAQYDSPINPFMHPVESAYDSLKTKSEKDAYIQNFLNENPHDAKHIPPRTPPEVIPNEAFDCTRYSSLIGVDGYGYNNPKQYNGYNGEDLDSIYANNGTLSHNGTGKIPMLGLDVFYMDKPVNGYWLHNMNIMYTGDDLSWESANAIEPQTDSTKIQPGSWQMPLNCNLRVRGPPTENLSPISSPHIIKYEVRNGVVSGPIFEDFNIKPENVKLLIKERDTIPPEINHSIYDNILKYEASDDNLKKVNYSVDGLELKSASKNGEIDLSNLAPGEHKVSIIAEDYFRNRNSIEERIVVEEDTNKIPTSTKAKGLEKITKFYPNPVSSTGTFEYSAGKDVEVSLYNSSGQELEKVIDNDKDGRTSVDFSKYSPGIYFYKTSDGSSGKILKD